MVDDDDQARSEVVAPPRRHGLGRQAMLQRPERIRVGQDQDRPSYSADHLKELRDSTPSTPKVDEGKVIDVTAKFGELARVSAPAAIPSETEIREKKSRRARMAKEQDYISLDDTAQDDFLDRKEKPELEEDTRLVRDDEDFAEGFDEFVDDGRVTRGRRAEREQNRRQKEAMRDLIDEAEAVSDDEDSDIEDKAAYETAQTRAAMGNGGATTTSTNGAARSKTPPKVTALPRLSTCIDRLRATMLTVESSRSQMINRMEDLRKEKADIAVREVEVQTMIKEAGENYERLKREAGVTPGSDGESSSMTSGMQRSRGLENIGESTTPSIGYG